MVKYWVFFFWILGISALGQQPLFTALTASQTGIGFANQIPISEGSTQRAFFYLWNGGGVAIGDLNNDGLPDIFISGNLAGCKVYINKGKLKFEDKTAQMMPKQDTCWNTGVTLVDVNADGWLDAYVCQSVAMCADATNKLYINEAGKRFTEQAQQYGLNIKSNATQAYFFDADQDSDLDVYINVYQSASSQTNILNPSQGDGKDIFLVNKDNKYFETKDTQLDKENGFGLSTVVYDFSGDGKPDLYVANDLITPDALSLNKTLYPDSPIFENKTSAYLQTTSFSSMGSDLGDIDNNGLLDLFTVDMFPEEGKRQLNQNILSNDHKALLDRETQIKQYVKNSLQVATAPGIYREMAYLAGLAESDWSWSPLIFDFDNDGWNDVAVSNSLRKDYLDRDFSVFSTDTMSRFNKPEQVSRIYNYVLNRMPDFCLQNKFWLNGKNYHFSDISSTLYNNKKVNTNAMAYGDLDGDGDLDLVLNNLDTTAFVLESKARQLFPQNQYVAFGCKAQGKNPNGFGTQIKLYSSAGKQSQVLLNARGFQSASNASLHFGLGPNAKIDSVEIIWPDNSKELRYDIKPNTFYPLAQKEQRIPTKKPTNIEPLFSEISNLLNPVHKHIEDGQNDFKADPILMKQLSRTGPGIAVGDVNADGKTDFYICGAKGKAGSLYLKREATYNQPILQPWQQHSYQEQSSALFIDVDNDKDLDLVVAAGGYGIDQPDSLYYDQLYINNGQGFFSIDNSFPKLPTSKSCLSAADWDNDGDLDLFIGSRYQPGKYPLIPPNYLLENQNGKFVDITAKAAPELLTCGMVNSALWTDTDNDGTKDLFLVGEWMPPTLLKNNGKSLRNANPDFGQSNMNGWWNSINGADLDNDGDIDYVLGNTGLNKRIKAQSDQPVKLYYPLLNSDNRPEPIITHFVKGVETLYPNRDKMLDQVFKLRKRYITYHQYADASIEDIAQQKNMPYLKAEIFSSLVLKNLGNNKFEILNLPQLAQAFPVFGTCITDLDNDNYLDLILTGNCHYNAADLGNETSGGILVLKGEGNGQFTQIADSDLGVFSTFKNSDTKSVSQFLGEENSRQWLITANNGTTKLLAESNKSKTFEILVNDTTLTFDKYTKRKIEIYHGQGYWSQHQQLVPKKQ